MSTDEHGPLVGSFVSRFRCNYQGWTSTHGRDGLETESSMAFRRLIRISERTRALPGAAM
jgi:hypothetical protein